jgi:16S rRNA (adenine1518-N6/adenine1519-N6)-dimethyltransferase
LDNPLKLPPLNVSTILRQYGLQPKKKLGQNFLVDPNAIQRVVEAADISSSDIVLEIGAGIGNLTRHLAAKSRKVIAIEVDKHLIPPLNNVLSQFPNVHIVHGDILALDPAELVEGQPYLVTANIPYYITSSTIRHLLTARVRPIRVVLTIQHEVALRLCASNGNMNLLALSVQVFGSPRIITRIPARAFYPPPKVDSAVVRVDIFPQPLIPASDLDLFFHLIRAGFSQKRKTLRNALSSSLPCSATQIEEWLKSNRVDAHRRAETLDLDEWKKLVSAYHQLIEDN